MDIRESIPSCSATDRELAHQRDRQARLAPGIERVEHSEEAMVISFAEGFDREALEEMLEVERRCCPFFVFEYDERERRLTTTVRAPEERPALAALAAAIAAPAT